MTSLYSAGDADRQRARTHLGAQAAAIPDHVTIELIGVGVIEPYFDLSGLPLIDPVIGTRAQGDQAEQHAEPVSEAMRRRHVHIESAVVRPRTRDQGEIAGQHADIADRADHGVAATRTMIIKGDPHVDRCTPEGLGGRNEVGPGTDHVLELRAGLVHDHGIDAQALR